MARLARLVIPGLPHHVTQRGNRRQQTFFCDEDYLAYVELMAQWCTERGVAIWGYCLMPNHIHLIAVPQSEDALARAIGEAHRRSTRNSAIPEEELRDLRGHGGHGHTSHPCGSATFVERLERMVGRRLRPGKPGRRSKLLKRP